MTTGVERHKTPPMTGWRQIFFDLLHRAAVGQSPPLRTSLSILWTIDLTKDNILVRILLKHIRSNFSHFICFHNHFSNWSNKTLTSHSWTWAGEFELITNFKEALSIESRDFSYQTANTSSLTGSSLVRIAKQFLINNTNLGKVWKIKF